MRTASGAQPRRATSDDVRAVLFADPKAPWSPPRSSESGLTFTLRSEVDIEWMRRRLDKNVTGGSRTRALPVYESCWQANTSVRRISVRTASRELSHGCIIPSLAAST